jgi:hypothetical protein
VTVDEVRQATLTEIEINGTPTLLLLDRSGRVKHVWLGKLPSEKESDVVTTLTQ